MWRRKQKSPPVPQGALSDFLARHWLGPRQAYKSLALWPLLVREDAPPQATGRYETLGEAMAAGTLTVDEVGRMGSVPKVKITNRGAVPVLFLFGEEIVGAKQNRVGNASFLVPADAELVVDVSCVEAGRWSRARGGFRSSDHVLSSSLRQKMAREVEASRARGAGYTANQRQVWEDIEDRLRLSGIASRSSAYADYRASRGRDLDEISEAFQPRDGQTGFVACIGDEVAGLEAIGRPDVFASSFRALLHSYAIDAVDASLLRQIDGAAPTAPARFDGPEPFLEALARAPLTAAPSLGLGQDLRVQGPDVAGCALHHEALIHLTAFLKQSEPR